MGRRRRSRQSARQWVDRYDIQNAVEVLRQKGERVLEAAKRALREGVEEVVMDAKSRVPVKTGKLRDSIHAIEKEEGAVQELTANARNSKGVPYGRIIEYSPKISKPYLYPALQAHIGDINRKMADAIRESTEH